MWGASKKLTLYCISSGQWRLDTFLRWYIESLPSPLSLPLPPSLPYWFALTAVFASSETVKMLMTIFDVDRSGTIGFNEFQGLWQYIKDWQQTFRNFDRVGFVSSALAGFADLIVSL